MNELRPEPTKHAHPACSKCTPCIPRATEREIFIDNLLVRVHFDFSRPALRHGSLNSLFQARHTHGGTTALQLPSRRALPSDCTRVDRLISSLHSLVLRDKSVNLGAEKSVGSPWAHQNGEPKKTETELDPEVNGAGSLPMAHFLTPKLTGSVISLIRTAIPRVSTFESPCLHLKSLSTSRRPMQKALN